MPRILNGEKKAWVFDGRMVVTATHPMKPNHDGNSRGRKIHLLKSETKTVCNMLPDAAIPDNDRNWSMVGNGRCKICFAGLPKFTEKDYDGIGFFPYRQ